MSYNLGTIQRQLAAIIEELKRARNTWEEINSHSIPIANKLTNSVIQSKYVSEPQYWHPGLTMTMNDLIEQYDLKMGFVIEKQNRELASLVEKMGKQYMKMQNQYKEVCAMCERTRNTNGIGFANNVAIFKTCSLSVYVCRIKSIVEMYSQELKTKESIASIATREEGLRKINSREEGMVVLSAWINQPSIRRALLQEWDDLCATEIS